MLAKCCFDFEKNLPSVSKICEILKGSFSDVSKPIFARKTVFSFSCFLYISGFLTCCSLTPRQADIYGIFCSAEIFTTSLHQGRELFVHLLFHFFFAEMTFLAAHAGGHPSGCPHRAGLILSKKRKKEKKEKDSQ